MYRQLLSDEEETIRGGGAIFFFFRFYIKLFSNCGAFTWNKGTSRCFCKTEKPDDVRSASAAISGDFNCQTSATSATDAGGSIFSQTKYSSAPREKKQN